MPYRRLGVGKIRSGHRSGNAILPMCRVIGSERSPASTGFISIRRDTGKMMPILMMTFRSHEKDGRSHTFINVVSCPSVMGRHMREVHPQSSSHARSAANHACTNDSATMTQRELAPVEHLLAAP